MAEYRDREHYIPLRLTDVIELLSTDKALPTAEREPFRAFCRLLSAYYHYEYHTQLAELKDLYAPFDPDAATRPLKPLSPEQQLAQRERLLEKMHWLMERANFKRLSQAQIEAATQGASEWGLNMDIDFSAFDHLEAYIRGEGTTTRSIRRMATFWRKDTVRVQTYQHIVVLVKQRQSARLGEGADTKNIFLKLFKDLPTKDLEMMIPGGRLKMPKFERGKLGASLFGTIGWVGYKLMDDFAALLGAIQTFNPLAFWGPLALVGGYGYKQYAGFQTTKQAYSLQLTQSLYYQNLDNNKGVLYHILDEAEEQDCREALLAYYYLWRYAGMEGWTTANLDDYVELDLERLANLKVDFEIGDALAKLERLALVEKVGEKYRAIALPQALERLDARWDNLFQYSKAGS